MGDAKSRRTCRRTALPGIACSCQQECRCKAAASTRHTAIRCHATVHVALTARQRLFCESQRRYPTTSQLILAARPEWLVRWLCACGDVGSAGWSARAGRTGHSRRCRLRAGLRPLVDRAQGGGERLRLLFWFGPSSERITLGALWADSRLGNRYLSVMDGCALVTDIDWVREPARGIATWLPCPMRVYDNAHRDDAAQWLSQLPTRDEPSASGTAVAYLGGTAGATLNLANPVSTPPIPALKPRAHNVPAVQTRKAPRWRLHHHITRRSPTGRLGAKGHQQSTIRIFRCPAAYFAIRVFGFIASGGSHN